jgi:hypothetical protein
MEKEWSFARRVSSLYLQYLEDVKSILIEHSDVIDISSIDLRWRHNHNTGYRSLMGTAKIVGTIKDKSGLVWNVEFVPEEPFIDANDVIYDILHEIPEPDYSPNKVI